MAEVFISYSSLDSAKAFEIVDQLEAAEINCWLSQRNIPPGADYALEIPKAITACSYFVLLLTNAAQDSPYVMLELDQAFKQKKEIIPILLEEVKENEKVNFFLNAKQKVNAITNLTSAINEVIRKISPANTERKKSNNDTTVPFTKKDPVKCPYCSDENLKLMNKPKNTNQLYYRNGKLQSQEIKYSQINLIDDQNALLELIQIILTTVTLMAMGGGLAHVLVMKRNKNQEIKDIWILVAIFLICAVIAVVSAVILWEYRKNRKRVGNFALQKTKTLNDAIGYLLDGINHSHINVHSMKCAKCEKEFCVLLPEDDSIENRVKNLIVESVQKNEHNYWKTSLFEDEYWDE